MSPPPPPPPTLGSSYHPDPNRRLLPEKQANMPELLSVSVSLSLGFSLALSRPYSLAVSRKIFYLCLTLSPLLAPSLHPSLSLCLCRSLFMSLSFPLSPSQLYISISRAKLFSLFSYLSVCLSSISQSHSQPLSLSLSLSQIGRASCRERVCLYV